MKNLTAALSFALLSAAARGLDASEPHPKSLEEYRHFALIHEGDPLRGKDLFSDQQRTACSRCHTIDGTASKAGPDLFTVGDKFGRGEIIESVLSPSASIAVGYSSTTLETRSEEVYTGI